MARVAALVVLALAGTACGGSERSSQYIAAGATLAAGVAGAGIYRATSGGCWGQCLDGTVCERASGRCVHVEEHEDPRAPHVVRVNCLADQPDCDPSVAAPGEPKSEAERANELVELLLRGPAVELAGHGDKGCRALATGPEARTLQDVLKTRFASAERRGRCTKADSVTRCTLTLRASGSTAAARELELVFDVVEQNAREIVVPESLACSLAP
jgi:hypothetical protein